MHQPKNVQTKATLYCWKHHFHNFPSLQTEPVEYLIQCSTHKGWMWLKSWQSTNIPLIQSILPFLLSHLNDFANFLIPIITQLSASLKTKVSLDMSVQLETSWRTVPIRVLPTNWSTVSHMQSHGDMNNRCIFGEWPMLGQKQRECGEESGLERLGGSVYVLSHSTGVPQPPGSNAWWSEAELM